MIINVKACQLGTNCWSPLRFTGHCYKCQRYEYCTYPERVADKTYDNLVKEYVEAKRKLEGYKWKRG